MTWVYRKADQHKCDPPVIVGTTVKIAPGDVWKCDDCGLIHVLLDSQRDGQYWSSAPPTSDLFLRTVQRLMQFGVDTAPLYPD